jgi:transmembrane sensor
VARKAKSELDSARDAAAAWVVRLSDPKCRQADRAAFATWREQSTEHELAFELEQGAWDRLDRLQALRPAGAEPDADLLQHVKTTPAIQSAPLQATSIRWAAAACLLAGVVAAGISLGPLSSPAYATAIGERRVVILPDRTRVELNSDSKIIVSFNGGRHRIRLVRGEALFDVGFGSSPLLILAKDAAVKATGAQMDVRLDQDRAAVVVIRGEVTLERPAAAPLRIAADTRVSFAGNRFSAQIISDDDLNRNLAWRQDGIDLTGRTLEQAADEFNRYNQRHVFVDRSISNLKLGGYFHNSDVEGFVRAVTIAFPVAARTDDTGQVLLSRRGAIVSRPASS